MSDLIAPQVLKGFRDSLPQNELPKRELMANLEEVFQSFGFVPIDTPALEYAEILLGKGGGETEKQMFRFEDNGGRDVALRFDLTVPFARFMASNSQTVGLPFKRYHMAKVWRGEKPQKGRYREFYQCDCDIVGVDSASADFEILMIMSNAMARIGAGDVSIRINHRGLFNRFLDAQGIRDRSVDLLRTVDKLAKIGAQETRKLLVELVSEAQAAAVLAYIGAKGSFLETLAQLEAFAGGECDESIRMKQVFALMQAVGIEDRFVLDPSITRGLDYYTGLVFETFLDAMPELGSVCSGGRYNDLANLYTKEKLPGIGGSVGLDRLLVGLEELGKISAASSKTRVLVLNSSADRTADAHRWAAGLRDAGIATEVYLDEKKLAAQYKYAETKGIPLVASWSEGTGFQIKNLSTGTLYKPQSVAEAARAISAGDYDA